VRIPVRPMRAPVSGQVSTILPLHIKGKCPEMASSLSP
jgi:hypothetical protein